MQITVAELIKSQMRLVGAIAQGEAPTTSEYAEAMQANNMMLDSWSARSLLVRALTRESFTLVASTASYTIGTGKTFSTSKPITVPSAFLRDSDGNDTPLHVMTRGEYDGVRDKTISGTPTAIFYDPGAAQQAAQGGTIYLYPVPDAADTLFIEQQKYLTEFAATGDTVTFEPAYYRAIKFNGALEYYHEYRSHMTQPPLTVVQNAKESLRIIETMNAAPMVCGFEFGRGGRYDVVSDSYR